MLLKTLSSPFTPDPLLFLHDSGGAADEVGLGEGWGRLEERGERLTMGSIDTGVTEVSVAAADETAEERLVHGDNVLSAATAAQQAGQGDDVLHRGTKLKPHWGDGRTKSAASEPAKEDEYGDKEA